MEKAKKGFRIFGKTSKIMLIVLASIMILFLGVMLCCKFFYIKLHVTYNECVGFDNFDSVKEDFERIGKLAKDNGEGIYSIIGGELLRLEEKSDNKQIIISNDDKKCIENIRSQSLSHTDGKRSLDEIRVKENSIAFEYGESGCGIVYTAEIRDFMKELTKSGEEYGYKKLAENWYSYYR